MLRPGRLVFALSVAVTTGSPALAGDLFRVYLRDGRLHDSVDVGVDWGYKVLHLNRADSSWAVSFSSVSRVTDLAGHDATASFLGSYAPAQAEEVSTREMPGDPATPQGSQPQPQETTGTPSPAEPEGAPGPPPATLEKESTFNRRPSLLTHTTESRRKRRTAYAALLSGGGGVSWPMSDYYEGIGAGGGASVCARLALHPAYSLRLDVLHAAWDNDLVSSIPGAVVLRDEMSIAAWRYSAAIEVYQWPWRKSSLNVMWYAFTGLSLVRHVATGTMEVLDPTTSLVLVIEGTGGHDKVALTYGAGLMPMLSPKLGVDIGIRADMVFVESANGTGSAGAIILDARGALVLIL